MFSIKSVLVPVDFSDPSRKAVQCAFSLARKFGAKVVLAHIVADPAKLTPTLSTESHALANGLYEAASKDILKLIPPGDNLADRVETIVRIADIDAELLNIVREQAIDLVVMGTHGRRNPARWFLGSVTERMLRQVPVPVLTISHVERDCAAIQHLLYATDMGDKSTRGFHMAAEFAKAIGAKLTIIHVVEHLEYIWAGSLTGYLREQTLQLVKMSRKHLAEFINREKPAGVDIDWMVVEGHPYEAILEAAKERNCDMIIMNLQSKSLADRAFLGATAERVVRLSHLPVLSIPLSKPE